MRNVNDFNKKKRDGNCRFNLRKINVTSNDCDSYTSPSQQTLSFPFLTEASPPIFLIVIKYTVKLYFKKTDGRDSFPVINANSSIKDRIKLLWVPDFI